MVGLSVWFSPRSQQILVVGTMTSDNNVPIHDACSPRILKSIRDNVFISELNFAQCGWDFATNRVTVYCHLNDPDRLDRLKLLLKEKMETTSDLLSCCAPSAKFQASHVEIATDRFIVPGLNFLVNFLVLILLSLALLRLFVEWKSDRIRKKVE